jgi:two-component system NtrC family sensor kinase
MNRVEELPIFQNSLKSALPLVSSFLQSAATVFLAVIDRDFRLTFANPSFTEILKSDFSDLEGKDFIRFFTAPDGQSLTTFLTAGEIREDQTFLLNIVDSQQVPHSLLFRFAFLPEGFLMIGEPPREANGSLQEELMELNNRLSVISRENTRKSRELAKALAELKKTQSMLVQQEKMASLGLMTAGIAHEINNPLAFVLGNEQVLKRDFEDLLSFINILGDSLPSIAGLSPGLYEELIGKAQEIDLEYLSQSLPRKITANIEGLERVKQIILDLRTFSRLDEGGEKSCHLAENIQSVIRFLGPMIQEYGVTMETDFAPLPPLFCIPGPLNQAVNNILTNAVQASSPGKTVRISTRMEKGEYCIEISDQGCGIDPENLTRVFDPFITTKPVGSGTGLGLSISHEVISAQGGKIEIESLPESGTRVRILLPQKNQVKSRQEEEKKE